MGLGERQVPRVCVLFVSEEAHGLAGRAVRQLSEGGPDLSAEVSDQEGLFLFSYSPEEIARKQRDELVFRWLVGSLESGIVP